ncbi:MAG: PilT/PilU family type 4a pilus ATPase [Myxococcales bacterium]|nr:PilT/PilU family type 4a pilus ATPase [Myxococcales bacterium]
MIRVHNYFHKLKEMGASDLHLAADRPPMYRASGEVQPIPGEPVLSDAELRDILREAVSETDWNQFETCHDLDFATAVDGLARFRGNYLEQHNGVSAVFRMVPEEIIPAEKLGLSAAITNLADLDAGLVLVTGPTGSGKSTTLAAIIDLVNRNHAKHIVTIEDPVEFVHQNKRSILSHRQVGPDTDAFADALKAAVRQDADVILVGEMRDYETISLALEAASMGVLVFGTLHTNGASKTVDRIIDAFPADQQDQARNNLAESLAAVVSQLLARREGGGRVGVHEILLRTSGLPGAIRDGKTAMLNSVIESGAAAGMQSMDACLMRLVREGTIAGHEAYLKANDKKQFQRWAEG